MSAPPDGRFDLDSLNVINLTQPVWVEYDYTHPDVAAEYASHIQVIYNIFNKPHTLDANGNIVTPAPDDEAFISPEEATAVSSALNSLLELARDGRIRNNTETSTKTFFLTKEMASNLDLLVRSFKAVGATGDTTITVSDAQLEKWKDLSVTSPVIQDILEVAIAAIPMNRSLQALIELEYVRTGNELIEAKFSDLEEALGVTQQVLTSLANLQDVYNRQVIEQRGEQPSILAGARQPFPPSNAQGGYLTFSAGSFEGFYRSAGQTYYGPIVPIVPSTLVIYNATRSITGLTDLGITVFNNLIAIKRSLQTFIPRLSEITDVAGQQDPNSLLNRVKKLVDDFNAAFVSGTTLAENLTGTGTMAQGQALAQFLLDNQNTRYSDVAGRTPGDSQQNLTFAMTSAQGLNDRQKEEVRRFLFVFEEFYKSAAAMLQRITQILEKMAQNISR
jgi:hypothetical protein